MTNKPLKEDWVKQFQELELSNDGGLGEPISLAKLLSWSNQKLIHDFISKLLSQSKSQIVKQIDELLAELDKPDNTKIITIANIREEILKIK